MQPHKTHAQPFTRLAALFLALCLSMQFMAASARAATQQPARSATALLVADGWRWSSVWQRIENGLYDRTRVIQLATVGMIIGLYIMLKK